MSTLSHAHQVSPFKTLLRSLRILNRPLEIWQKEAVEGLKSIDFKSLTPSLFLTPGLCHLAPVLREENRHKSYMFEFKHKNSLFTPFSAPTRSVAIEFYRTGSVSQAAPVVLNTLGRQAMTVKPYGPSPHKLDYPIFEEWAMNIEHWVQLLDANVMALCAQGQAMGSKKAFRRAAGVKVHPTALIENSVLEAGAEVEAFASVRNSHVGERAKVAAHTLLDHCVLGSGSQTLVDSHLRRVIVGHNSTVANLGLYDSVIGDNAFVTTAVSVFGQKSGQYPEIEGKKVFRPVVGICIGDGAIVGARALFQAGSALPKGIIVVGRADEVAAKLDAPGLNRGKMQIGHKAEHV